MVPYLTQEKEHSRSMRKTMLAGAGGVLAAFLGSLCCLGPLLFVTLGVGAGLASTFEPLRPVFAVVMLGLFAVAFYSVYGRPAARAQRAVDAADGEGTGDVGAPGGACPVPRHRTREKLILWIAVFLALVLWAFPAWSGLLV